MEELERACWGRRQDLLELKVALYKLILEFVLFTILTVRGRSVKNKFYYPHLMKKTTHPLFPGASLQPFCLLGLFFNLFLNTFECSTASSLKDCRAPQKMASICPLTPYWLRCSHLARALRSCSLGSASYLI